MGIKGFIKKAGGKAADADGNMHTDFDYTDLSSGTYQFKKAWKKKYLV